MSRKPHSGPPILRIEGLSTGIDPTMRDDTTGEVLAQPNAKPPKVQDAQAQRDTRNRQARLDKQLLLECVGIMPKSQLYVDAVLAQPRVERKHGPIIHVQGVAKELVLPKRPFRRM